MSKKKIFAKLGMRSRISRYDVLGSCVLFRYFVPEIIKDDFSFSQFWTLFRSSQSESFFDRSATDFRHSAFTGALQVHAGAGGFFVPVAKG